MGKNKGKMGEIRSKSVKESGSPGLLVCPQTAEDLMEYTDTDLDSVFAELHVSTGTTNTDDFLKHFCALFSISEVS